MTNNQFAGTAGGYFTKRDTVALLVIFVAAFAYWGVVYPWSSHPFEDAAMLMRYAQHLAEGYGIVWNIGEMPTDGATDFLFLLATAGVTKLGLGVDMGVRVLGAAAHLLTIALVYWGLRRLYRLPRWVVSIVVLLVALGPGWGYVAAYFGTTFFALFATATWVCALILLQQGSTLRWSAGFAACGLLTGLTRPEGVPLVALMAFTLILSRGWRAMRKPVLWLLAALLVLGGTYFLWRWQYFGYPLPNPFYKKGGGVLHLEGLRASVVNGLLFFFPVLWAFLFGFRSRSAARSTIVLSLPIMGFLVLWVLLSNEMNYLARFQYAVLPMALLTWPALLAGLQREWNLPSWKTLPRTARRMLVVGVCVLAFGMLAVQLRLLQPRPNVQDGRYDAAHALRGFSHRGYTMATTEAGLLPYYSQWRAIDAWGLNDRRIARERDGITPERLAEERPELIVFHGYFSPMLPSPTATPWDRMASTLNDYARQNFYILAASYGVSPYDSHFYYVKQNFPDSAAIVAALRALPSYGWSGSGNPAINFARYATQ